MYRDDRKGGGEKFQGIHLHIFPWISSSLGSLSSSIHFLEFSYIGVYLRPIDQIVLRKIGKYISIQYS